MDGIRVTLEYMRNNYKILIGKFEKKRPFETPKNRLQNIGCEGEDEIQVSQNMFL
jgi:hypothetical protein